MSKKKILVVLGHPYEKSFDAAVFASYTEGIDREKCEVRTLELGKMKFDPVLRYGYSKFMEPDPEIEYSQECVLWADHITFIFPVWWGSAPSLLTGWIDRAFVPGKMYSMRDFHIHRLIKGKTAHLITTMRSPWYAQYGSGNTALSVFRLNLFPLTGIRNKKTLILRHIHWTKDSEKRRAKFLAKARKLAAKL